MGSFLGHVSGAEQPIEIPSDERVPPQVFVGVAFLLLSVDSHGIDFYISSITHFTQGQGQVENTIFYMLFEYHCLSPTRACLPYLKKACR
jgi:hypothetical protein